MEADKSETKESHQVARNSPCTCCGWNPDRHGVCEGNLVRRIHGRSGTWSLWRIGSEIEVQTALLDEGEEDQHRQADSLRWLAKNTTMPVVKCHLDWVEDGKIVLVKSTLKGTPASDIWGELDDVERRELARQVVQAMLCLRTFTSDKLQTVANGPTSNSALWNRKGPKGPLSNDDEIRKYLGQELQFVRDDSLRTLLGMMPPCAPFVATMRAPYANSVYVEINNATSNEIDCGRRFQVVGFDIHEISYMPCWWWLAECAIRASPENKWFPFMAEAIYNLGEEVAGFERGLQGKEFLEGYAAVDMVAAEDGLSDEARAMWNDIFITTAAKRLALTKKESWMELVLNRPKWSDPFSPEFKVGVPPEELYYGPDDADEVHQTG
jgi:hypothetical protein